MMLCICIYDCLLICGILLIVIPFTVINRLKFPSVLVVYIVLDVLAIGMSTFFL